MADTKEDLQNQKKLYELYQLEWMMSHGYSLMDIMKSMSKCPNDNRITDDEENGGMKADIPGIFRDWEFESGLDGTCWVCFGEFLDGEFLIEEYVDQDLICSLDDQNLCDELWKWYRDYKDRNPELDWR